ncbi:MAG: hypothetical protein R2744_05025 [Bacteroidales bacterium]
MEAGIKLVLADRGRPDYQVVIMTGSDSTVVAAANDLAGYLSKVSGADFNTVAQGEGDSLLSRIYVGIAQNRGYVDGVQIYNSGRDLYICGNSSQNTSYSLPFPGDFRRCQVAYT